MIFLSEWEMLYFSPKYIPEREIFYLGVKFLPGRVTSMLLRHFQSLWLRSGSALAPPEK